MADDADPMRNPRSSVIIRALIEVPGVQSERRVRNLSATGACVDDDGTLATGMILRVSMGSIHAIEAEVMWTRATLAGIRFAWPVDLREARRPRGSAARFTAAAGWVVEVDDPYRRRG
ncbi:PilZ domain-containing protein [Sphingomonas sp. SUN019]|uniref:PilZ domain-containing protein n=1 Tax=Sphingomonas sp. SUN019 TaxID=2937788 RepID=UPI0021641EA1|nr:PilZ domain-containing protein [Sphingomonas sp. SUN019]UVO50974.1 PilZ domain-containing protein [Sphingomonas sp. SUN019]